MFPLPQRGHYHFEQFTFELDTGIQILISLFLITLIGWNMFMLVNLKFEETIDSLHTKAVSE